MHRYFRAYFQMNLCKHMSTLFQKRRIYLKITIHPLTILKWTWFCLMLFIGVPLSLCFWGFWRYISLLYCILLCHKGIDPTFWDSSVLGSTLQNQDLSSTSDKHSILEDPISYVVHIAYTLLPHKSIIDSFLTKWKSSRAMRQNKLYFVWY